MPDDVAEIEEKTERWWLITQLPPAKPESKADLEILREVSREELLETREANALLNRLANAAPYARLVELYQQLEAALNRGNEKRSWQRAAAEMNHASRALGRVATAFPEEIRKNALNDFGAGSDEVRQLDAAIADECLRPPFRLLAAVGNLEHGPFATADDGIGNDAEAITALAADLAEVQPTVDLVTTLRAGVLVAQRLIGRQLQIYEERLTEAALFLRRVATEAVDGAPALMRADSLDPSSGKLDIGRATFDPLALDSAVYLHRALRHARALLAATGDEQASHTAVEEASDEASAQEPRPREPAPDPGESAVSAQEAAVPAEAPEPPPGDRADQVLDLRALAAHATELTDALERAWSEALDHAALSEAQQELGARLSSLLRAIQRRVAAGDRVLRNAGINSRIAAFPLPVEELAKLSLDPDLEQRWRQLQLAEIEALTLLLEGVRAMGAPSAHSVTLATGEVESWWEAGAFELVRSRARLLVRVSEAAEAAETTMIGNTLETEGAAAFFDRLRLAGDAFGRADVESVFLHAGLALRLRAALEIDPVPDDLVARLAASPQLGDERPLLRLLDEASTTLASGKSLELGAAMLAAPRILKLVGRLCLEDPEIIREAVGARESDGS